MEIIITIAIVAAALFFLIRKIRATKNADCSTCRTCDTDCSIYTPERAMGIEFINREEEKKTADN
jgi:hypothetical protein